MDISLDILNYMLPRTKVLNRSGQNYRFKCALMYSVGQSLEKSILYIAEFNDIMLSEPKEIGGMTFVPIGATEKQCMEFLRYCNCTFLLFPQGTDGIQAHRDVQMAMVRFFDWISQIDNSVYCSGNVQEIMQHAGAMFRDPVLAWNPAFELMATANTEGLDLEKIPPLMRNFLVNRGWSGEDVDIMLKKHDYLTMPMRYMDIRHILPPNMMNCHSYARNFSLSGKIVMTAGVYFIDGSVPQDGKVELIRLLFYRVMRFFELHSSVYSGSRKIYESFIMELIEGKLKSETDIRDRLSYLNFPYVGEFEVIVISCDNDGPSMALGFIRNYCKSYFRHTKFIEYRNHLVGINNRMRDNADVIEKRPNMFSDVNILSDYHLGISSVFTCLRDTEEAFNQAKIALKYGRSLQPDTQYYSYEDYFVYYILSQVCSDEHGILGCPDASYIYRLRNMDKKKKGVDNEKLFVSYIMSGCNTSKTAEIMNLHRNSILYRINQIESVLNVDLTNPETLFHMILGIKAAELQDALDQKKDKDYSL